MANQPADLDKSILQAAWTATHDRGMACIREAVEELARERNPTERLEIANDIIQFQTDWLEKQRSWPRLITTGSKLDTKAIEKVNTINSAWPNTLTVPQDADGYESEQETIPAGTSAVSPSLPVDANTPNFAHFFPPRRAQVDAAIRKMSNNALPANNEGITALVYRIHLLQSYAIQKLIE